MVQHFQFYNYLLIMMLVTVQYSLEIENATDRLGSF